MENNLARVADRIGPLVKEFCVPGRTFRMRELTEYVERNVGGIVAPDSPGRILRMARATGVLNYKLISRRDSTYIAL